MSYPKVEPRMCSWLLHQAIACHLIDGAHYHLFDCYHHFPSTSTITSVSPPPPWLSSTITFLPAATASQNCYSQPTRNRVLLLPLPEIMCSERYMCSPLMLARPRKNRQEFKLLPRYLGASWNLRLAGACKMCFVKLTWQLP